MIHFGLASLLTFLFSIGAFGAQKTEFYFFINADNDLVTIDADGNAVHQGEILFKTLQSAGLTTKENTALHVFIDPNSMVSGKGFDSSKTLRCALGTCAEEVFNASETDLTDTSILDQFLSKSFFDAAESKKILVFWGHGDSWRKLKSFDFSSPEKKFSTIQYAGTIQSHGIDLLIFDACSMASLEIATVFKNSVKFLAASPYELPVEGLNWNGFSQALSKIEAGELDESFEMKLFEEVVMATKLPLLLLDLSKFDAFISEMNAVFKPASIRQMSENEVSVSRYLKAIEADPAILKTLIVDGMGPLAMTMPDTKNLVSFITNQDVKDFLAEDFSKALPNWNYIRNQSEELK